VIAIPERIRQPQDLRRKGTMTIVMQYIAPTEIEGLAA
jgi:hypothetical protein